MTLLNLLWHRTLPDRLRKAQAGESIIAVMFVPILAAWLNPLSAEDRLWAGPALSLAMIGYGVLFRNRLSQVTGQSFVLTGLASYVSVSIPQTPLQISFAPLAALGVAAVRTRSQRHNLVQGALSLRRVDHRGHTAAGLGICEQPVAGSGNGADRHGHCPHWMVYQFG